MELDHLVSAAPVGKPNERKSCAAISLAVDAESGMILAPEINKAGVEAGDAVARVFFKAVQANRALPKEVRVRSQKLKDSLVPLMDSFGVSIRVLSRLPGADRARAHLLSYIQGD
jgi:aconitase B